MRVVKVSQDLNNLEKGKIDLNALKSGGYMKQKQQDLFSVRVKIMHGNVTAVQLDKISELAKKYGNGEVHITVRQGFEIPFVDFDNLMALTDELKEVGLTLGACGPRVRCVVACQGDTLCVHGLGNTQDLAKRLDKEFYGMHGLPHKFKMGVTGCPFSCAKPQENDAGYMGVVEPELDPAGCITCGLCIDVCPTQALSENEEGIPEIDYEKCIYCGECVFSCASGSWKVKRQGWNVFVGGKWGREPQIGVLFEEFVPDEEVLALTARLIEAYKKLGHPRERFGSMINRIGLDKFTEEVRRLENESSTTAKA